MRVVREVLAELLRHGEGSRSEVDDWEVHIVESDTADTVAFPGGGLIVGYPLIACPADFLGAQERGKSRGRGQRSAKAASTTGCASAARKQAGARRRVLSVVLSHEVSHVQEGHFAERLKANAKPLVDEVKRRAKAA